MQEKSKRLMSLDALRGFDMFWIIGGERVIHAWSRASDNRMVQGLSEQFHHADWNGFRFYDLIFPLFIFMAGVSMPFAITSKVEKGEDKSVIIVRLLKRLILLLVLGAVYNGVLDFDGNPRFASVLARIAVSTFLAGVVVLYFELDRQLFVLIGILIGYWLAISFFAAPGFAGGDLSIFGNFVSYIDSNLLPGRLHKGIHDPEGILTNIPATATALLGVMSGHIIRSGRSETTKLKYLAGTGFALLAVSLVWGIFFPVNKNLWTSSFVLLTAGCSNLIFALFYYIIDIKQYRKWAYPFQWIGVNSILIYMLAGGKIVNFEAISLFFCKGTAMWISKLYTPMIISITAILIEIALLRYLFKKKTFLKV